MSEVGIMKVKIYSTELCGWCHKAKDWLKENKIDFEDPGNDEIGQDVKELDALINGTTPSELSGDDLSDEMIESK